MIELRKFKAQDMLDLLDRGVQEDMTGLVSDCVCQIAHEREKQIGSRTAAVNDVPIASAGVEILHEGVGEMWGMFSTDVDAFVMPLCRILREVVKKIIEVNRLHRLQCHVRTDFWRGLRLVQFLGFEEEGIARMYTPHKYDCYLFSMVSKNG